MKRLMQLTITALLLVSLSSCGLSDSSGDNDPVASEEITNGYALDDTYIEQDGIEVIYVAGGCFWGTEKLMQSIPGVVAATSGYANGEKDVVPDYGNVAKTGYKETVRVEYEPDSVSLDTILFAYFRSIDPTIENRQGNDIGTQYQAGIYWVDEVAKETVQRIAAVEMGRYNEFAVEIEPLRSFYLAEDYHQDYLDKNPQGYCHIPSEEFERVQNSIVDPADYQLPALSEIKAILTDEQYRVTQEAATETPFDNEYWDNYEKGIYVDIVTGEPLFSSSDKFDSGTGWPSFSQTIDENTVVFLTDSSLGTIRTEVRSRAGNSHLGHVFYGEKQSPGGVRFCINSAALRFISYDQMNEQGYSYLLEYVK